MYGDVNPPNYDGIYSEGETVNFTCPYPETLLIGAESSTCDADGAWNPEPPICRPCKLMIPLAFKLKLLQVITIVNLQYTSGSC